MSSADNSFVVVETKLVFRRWFRVDNSFQIKSGDRPSLDPEVGDFKIKIAWDKYDVRFIHEHRFYVILSG